MAAERMKYPSVRLNVQMIDVAASVIAECTTASPWRIAAASIESTHLHLLITYSGLDIHTTVKWLADRITKAIHRPTAHTSPVWAKGKWCTYIYDSGQWDNTLAYIERHNIHRGQHPRPYPFITTL